MQLYKNSFESKHLLCFRLDCVAKYIYVIWTKLIRNDLHIHKRSRGSLDNSFFDDSFQLSF
jgi:hypothetical protein